MKQIKKSTILLVILYFSALIIFSLINNNTPDKVKTVKNTIKHHYVNTVFVPSDIVPADPEIIKQFITITETDTIFEYDTIYYLLSDYYATYNYKDTINIDTIGFVALNDSIKENKLFYRDYDIDISYTTEIHKNVNFSLATGLYYMHSPYINSIGLTADIRLKKNVFGVGLGTDKVYMINYKRIIFER